MNRFLVVILLVAGIFGLPYLLWVAKHDSPVTVSGDSMKQLQELEGVNWLLKHQKGIESEGAEIELSIIDEEVSREEWDTAIQSDDMNKLLLIQSLDWLTLQDELFIREIEDYTGVHSTGWKMRYFEDLSASNPDIPESTLDLIEGEWTYEGPGYVFANERLEQVSVIPSQNMYAHGDGTSWEESSFRGWIELIDPIVDEDVEFWFQLPKDVTNQVGTIVNSGLIPAIIEREHPQIQSVYMTADFQKLESPPALYQIFGLSEVYGFFYKNRSDGFYWTTYTDQFDRIIEEAKQLTGETNKKNQELVYHSRVTDETFEVMVDGNWESILIKGVNVGMGKPGYFPGEAAILEEEYYRWFQQIGEMNANSIRVYTVQPPGFYRALKRYNEEHEKPLYIFHGTWAEEELLEETLDAFNDETMARFQKEYQDIVRIIHGDARILPQVGHASGTYDADISEYVIGWIMGIEWYPEMVVETNTTHSTIGDYEGTYITTKKASPFEHWLALHMDAILDYEVKQYNEIRPISFTNWVTTDLLEHPSEPLEDEDMVGVNPNVIKTQGDLDKVGQFASYHVYPYYPDFLNVDKKYREYVDQDGMKNSYAGYLNDLKKAHDMPVLVAEFGIPASRGGTHVNPYGWNQGNVAETDQGEIIAKLYRTIVAEDYLGGLVFSWQDEWFKRTWNTQEYDNPERRPYWSNQQTNEQHFGLVSFDSMKIKVDGEFSDWTEDAVLGSTDNKKISVTHDETYLYLRIEGIKEWQRAQILIDTLPDQGNKTIPGPVDIEIKEGIEFIIDLNRSQSRVVVDTYYDYYHYLYGNVKKMISPISKGELDSGKFTPIYYVLNKELYLPELDRVEPFQFYETGKLSRGNANPEAEDYNSLADYEYGEGQVEIRIPWLLLQFRDPSRMEVIGNLFKNGEGAAAFIESIGIGLVIDDQTLPEEDSGVVPELYRYSWEHWDEPTSVERLKPSYYSLQELFGSFD